MKAWTADIECHIQSWSERLGSLNWWPKYVYHFTDVNNAVRIIRSGSLYSRSECLRLNLMAVDNANVEVIQQTQREHLDFVRLYFRPRTPTQFLTKEYVLLVNGMVQVPTVRFLYSFVSIHWASYRWMNRNSRTVTWRALMLSIIVTENSF